MTVQTQEAITNEIKKDLGGTVIIDNRRYRGDARNESRIDSFAVTDAEVRHVIRAWLSSGDSDSPTWGYHLDLARPFGYLSLLTREMPRKKGETEWEWKARVAEEVECAPEVVSAMRRIAETQRARLARPTKESVK